MDPHAQSHFNTQIYEEACAWFVECRSGDLDAAARTEFDRWLRKSPEHLSAYVEIAARRAAAYVDGIGDDQIRDVKPDMTRLTLPEAEAARVLRPQTFWSWP